MCASGKKVRNQIIKEPKPPFLHAKSKEVIWSKYIKKRELEIEVFQELFEFSIYLRML